MPGDLTKNLSRSEFKCSCGCRRTPVDFDLPLKIQDCADHFLHEAQRENPFALRVAININSGYRCVPHNATVQGASRTSPHTLGLAADFWLELVYGDGTRSRLSDDSIADYLELTYPDDYGIGRYNNRTHFDVRQDGPARWDKR